MQYDDRCSDIAGVYLLGLHFRFAQVRPVTFAVFDLFFSIFSNFIEEICYIRIVMH